MTGQKILSNLSDLNIEFDLSESDFGVESQSFRFASLKNKIKNGIYFLVVCSDNLLNGIENSVIITGKDQVIPENKKSGNLFISVENPQLAHYKLSSLLEPEIEPGIHPTSIIHPEAVIHPGASIGPFCVIGKCVIEEGVQLLGLTKVFDNSVIKKNTIIESNCSIGARGIAWIWDEDGTRIRQPQLGGVIIEEDCYLGTDITVVRGSLSENTRIGEGTVIAHGTKIGHGSIIGKAVHMANNVSLAGNSNIGNHSFLGSACIISSNVKIASSTIVGAGSLVHRSYDEEFITLVGLPSRIIARENYKNKPKGAPKPFKSK